MGSASAETRVVLRAQRGLDLPPVQQYMRWLRSYASGDLGWSIGQQRPVADVLRDAIPPTLLLMSLALLTSLACGIALGAWQGAHAGSRGDRAWSGFSLALFSVPEFWLALMLLLVFVSWLHWLPSGGMASDDAAYYAWPTQVVDRLEHLVLPLLSLTLVGAAHIARFQRAAMRDVITLPFVRTARAKGLRERAVQRHALRAALLPMIAVSGMLIPSLLAGAVFVETIFAWPGMGSTMISALEGRDYDLLSAGIVVISAMTVLGSLGAEAATALADPRTRRT